MKPAFPSWRGLVTTTIELALVEERFHELRSRAFRRACGVLAVVAAALVSGPSLASPSARLIYARAAEAEGCPDEETVRAAVAARLGYDPFFPWAPNTVLVDLQRSGDRFRADVKLVDEHGVVRGARHLETRSECADLMEAMALTISLVVDPLSLSSTPRTAEPANSTPRPITEPSPEAPTPTVTSRTPPAPPPSSPHPERIHVYAGAGVLGSLGTAPAPSFGGDVLLGARRQVFSLEVDARGELPASRELTAGTAGSERLMGSLIPCLHLSVSMFCMVGSLAWVHASGSGLTSDRSGSAAAGALGARAGVELKLGPILRLRAYADLLAELFAPRLQIGGVDVYTLSPISGDIGLAALVQLF